MKVSRRIKSLAGLIHQDDHLIDIGCDHALLDIFLIKNNIINNCVISDISENALKNGIKNIKKYHLSDKIEYRIGNGLEVLDENIDTIIISGMGSNNIIKILNNPKIKNIKKLVIQSNNNHYLLRSFLTLKGFYISHEAVIYDNGKYYINIVFLKGRRKYSFKELMYGPILMYSNKYYFSYLLKKEMQILDNIPKYKIFKRINIYKQIYYLKKLSK